VLWVRAEPISCATSWSKMDDHHGRKLPSVRVCPGDRLLAVVAISAPPLDLYYLVSGVLVQLLWVNWRMQPARRASAVSPSVATRTVNW